MQDRQIGIFDFQKHYNKHFDFKDALVSLNELINWESFLPILKEGIPRKDGVGRKAYDSILMIKIIILKTQYNLSDDQTEYQIYDRYSFRRFLGLEVGESVPDAKTIWLFQNQLAELGIVEKLFEHFEEELSKGGYKAQKGQIIDASIIPVPKQRNSREENAEIKAGNTPSAWESEPNKLEQKDVDARWTKKNGISHYGYKNHIDIDVKHKLIRKYEVTDASVHDSQVVDEILDSNNTNADVYADSAYRSEKQEEKFAKEDYRSKVHHKGKRNKPLTEFKEGINKNRSKVRAKVEHIFGNQMMVMGGKLMRCIGKTRAKATIGLRNLVYNMNRFVFLSRQKMKTA